MSTQPSILPSAWSTLQPQEAMLVQMRVGELADVMAVERAAYPWPWSEGNLNDSIAHGYCCWALRNHSLQAGSTDLLGYFIAMPGADEVHLLNITVAQKHQRQGWARVMLDALVEWSAQQKAQWLWLEVRVSNTRAIDVYERYGFRRIGQRKGYYPLDGLQREDALVMNLAIRSS